MWTVARFLNRSAWWWPALLASLSLVVRYAVWKRLPAHYGPSVEEMRWYTEALTKHWWTSVYYDHTEPLAMHAAHALLLRLFGDAVYTRALLIWPPFLLDTLAALCVYAMARRLGVSRIACALISVIYSLALVPFECWRAGGTFDHYTLGAVGFFAWVVVMSREKTRLRNDVLLALAGAALVATQKSAFIVAPVVVLASRWGLRRERGARCAPSTLTALAGPLVMALLLMTKNACASGIFTVSSLSSVNTAQFTWAAQGYDVQKVYHLAERTGLPEWYRWCFQRAREFHPMGPFYGTCFAEPGSTTLRYNFEPLHAYLVSHGETRLAQIVAEDRQRFAERPYLHALPVPESAPRFAAEYSKVTWRLFVGFIAREPLTFMQGLVHAQYLYLVDGWRYLLLLPALAWMPYRSEFLVAVMVCSVLFALGYLATYLLAIRLWIRRVAAPPGVAPLLTGVLISSAVCTLVCCENGRYFLQMTPYLLPLVAYGLQLVVAQRKGAQP